MARGRRIVVKLGTHVVSRSDGALALGPLGGLVEQIDGCLRDGHQVILVSSGAVGLGASRLHLERPTSLADRQAAAAVGQGVLMAFYDALFTRVGRTVAQVLLTEDDFLQRSHYLDLHQAFERLLALGVVPVVNQNDVVSTKELALVGRVFGDNDRLAALVASNLRADLLVLLSDVDGLYTAPPGSPGAERIRIFGDKTYAIGEPSAMGTGGMRAKVEAARVASRSGVRAVIAHGHGPAVLSRILAGEDVGTTFPADPGLNRRRQWIAFAAAPRGRLVVNDGARCALLERDASLLWPGLTAVEGQFDEGDVVEIGSADGTLLGRGKARHGADTLRAGIGSGRGVIVHRDDMVLEER